MIDKISKRDCCGCAACTQKCPQKCIILIEDIEGFLYPEIEQDKCTKCEVCERVCPILNQKEPRRPLKIYATKNLNEEIRMESSSGGVFTLLAERILNDGGVVFGARFDEEWNVVHDYTDKVDELNKFRGSKYVQSIIGNSFLDAKKFLEKGRKVLFSGTPCQIAGLNCFLKTEYENLYTIDFICHGIPSPKVWRLYKKELLKKYSKNKIPEPYFTSINFRNKISGWKRYSFSSSFIDSKNRNFVIYESVDKNVFMKGFNLSLYLRPSCHNCPAKSLKSGSDITISDFWGVQRLFPEYDDDKGISLLMFNNLRYYNLLDNSALLVEVTYQQILRYNSSIQNSVTPHKNRERFFERITLEEFNSISIISLINQYATYNLIQKIKRKAYLIYSFLSKKIKK